MVKDVNQKENVSEKVNVNRKITLKDGREVSEYIANLYYPEPSQTFTLKQNKPRITKAPLSFSTEGKVVVHDEYEIGKLMGWKLPRTRESSGIDIDYYNEAIRRLYREHNKLIHPRTHEFVIGATNDRRPPRPNRHHLAGFPRVAYHRVVNRIQVSGKFIAVEKPKERKSPADVSGLKLKLVGELRYKNTSQWKTVYSTRWTRRR